MTNSPPKAAVRAIRSKTPRSVTAAASSGDERALLIALRDVLAQAIADGPPPRDLASLSRRLMEVSRELATLQMRQAQEKPARQPLRPLPGDERWGGGV